MKHETYLERVSGFKLQVSGLHFFDVGAEFFKAAVEIFIPPVYGICVVESRGALGREHANDENGSGAKGRRAHNLVCFQWRRPFDKYAMGVGKANHRAEFLEFNIIDGSVLIAPVVDHGRAPCLRGDGNEKGKIVNIEPGKRPRVYLIVER